MGRMDRDTGKAGAAGPPGEKGDAGTVGATGPPGETGDAGTVGATGPPGEKGDAGTVGATGPPGEKGDAGRVGATGPPGEKGDAGTVGATGPPGEKGDAGRVGTTGPPGERGGQGIKGVSGLPGPQGPYGTSGPHGPVGGKGDRGFPGLRGPQGVQGAQGPPSGKGEKGDTGTVGAPGPTQGEKGGQGVPGQSGPPGMPGRAGLQGEQGLPGLPAEIASVPGSQTGGVVYTRWGRTNCTSGQGTELVYSGRAGGTQWNTKGGSTKLLCLPDDPEYSQDKSGIQNDSPLRGVEYRAEEGQALGSVKHHNIPCAVCYASTRYTVLMIPAKLTCPTHWTTEYTGYLMTSHQNHYAHSDYECIDNDPESVPELKQRSRINALLYQIEADCNNLSCPPYDEEREVTCAVCTR